MSDESAPIAVAVILTGIRILTDELARSRPQAIVAVATTDTLGELGTAEGRQGIVHVGYRLSHEPIVTERAIVSGPFPPR